MDFNRVISKLMGSVFILAGIGFIITFVYIEGIWSVQQFYVIAFFGVFIVVGCFMVSTAANIWLSKKITVWNQGFRLGFGAFLLVGIAALIMAMAESLIFLVFGIPFTAVGAFGLNNFYKKRKRKQALLQTGRKIEIPNPVVERDTGNTGIVLETGQFVYPFIIKCTVTLPENQVPLDFVSDLIWIDPQPYLKDSVTVYVNPANVKEYTYDLSFLPKDERTISQRSFTFR